MPKPRGKYSQVAGYIALKVGIEIERLARPYFIPKECIVRAASQIPQGSLDKESGYEPDVIVLDAPALIDEP
jgi:Uma2 family endonuclease